MFAVLFYQVDEKRLTDQIQALKKEKNDALAKMSELQKQVRINDRLQTSMIYFIKNVCFFILILTIVFSFLLRLKN